MNKIRLNYFITIICIKYAALKQISESEIFLKNKLLEVGQQISDQHLHTFDLHFSGDRRKRDYWGFDRFLNDAVQANNHFGKLKKRVDKYIGEQNFWVRKRHYTVGTSQQLMLSTPP